MLSTTDIQELLIKEIEESGFSMVEIARKSGVAVSTIRRWIYGRHTANLENAQCVLKVIGKELQIKEVINNAVN